jgi:glycosyltransferase involved in cell wall biosynthesis
MPRAPLVSFCVPTYGRAAFIGRTLTSALEQTISDFEIVVVNDCSPDDTDQIVRSFRDPRIRYHVNSENLGVPENLNRAMSLARGDHLVLLEDHDLLAPTYLEETLRVMRSHPSVGFVAAGLIIIDEEDRRFEHFVEELPEFVPGRWLVRRLLTRADCPFSVTTVIRRSAAEGLSPLFDPRYWWYADQYLWLRLASRWDFGYVAKPLLFMRRREGNHYLNERVWESALCTDRIHKDAWPLLHPNWDLSARWDWLLYEFAKLRTVAGIRAGRMLRRQPWTQEDREAVSAYLSPPGRYVLGAMSLLPMQLLMGARGLRERRRRERFNPEGRGTASSPVE